MASTSVTLTLPVLPLDDEVVLPGMVVPLDLSDAEVRGAVEAAQAAAAGGKPKVLLVPRIDGTYAGTGVLGTVEQVGRLSDGDPGALIRGRGRVRIGAGTTGPGAALWVEGETVDEAVPDPLPGAVTELVKEYKALATSWLKKRGAWQVVDRVQQIEGVGALADNSGYSPFLSTAQKVELLETADPVARLRLAVKALSDHLAEQDVAESIAKDVQDGVDKQQREFLLKRQLEAVRKELRELSGEKEGRSPTTTGPGSRPPTCPRRYGRPPSRKSTSWSAPATSPPRGPGSAPGWTPSSNFPGTSGPRTSTTSAERAPSWTPSTPGSVT